MSSDGPGEKSGDDVDSGNFRAQSQEQSDRGRKKVRN